MPGSKTRQRQIPTKSVRITQSYPAVKNLPVILKNGFICLTIGRPCYKGMHCCKFPHFFGGNKLIHDRREGEGAPRGQHHTERRRSKENEKEHPGSTGKRQRLRIRGAAGSLLCTGHCTAYVIDSVYRFKERGSDPPFFVSFQNQNQIPPFHLS